MTVPVSSTSLSVAFTFASSGQEWQGGVNYFRALLLALHADATAPVRPVVFVGTRADIAQYGFPADTPIRRSRTLDRMSLPWVLNKLSAFLLGRPVLTNRLLLSEGISVLSHGAPTGSPRLRNAAWIPDFQHLHLPRFFDEKELRKRDALFRSTIERSSMVIVSSESARQDLLAFSPAHGDKARVLRFAAIPPVVDPDIRLDLAKTYGITGPYFYIPNQAWAHKNHLTAIEALAKLKDRPDVSVVCSGSMVDLRNPHHADTLRAAIEQHGLTDRFRMLGMVPYGHIAELMLQATAVINPSLFEGWSTTVEESKALGVPMILSDLPVHREQCEGLSARFFPPLDAEALVTAMREAVSAEPLTAAATKARMLAARARHAERMRQFSRDYAAIISELA